MYIPFIWNDLEGDWFGYGWASSFLWSLGNELTPIIISLFLWHLASHLPYSIQKSVKNISAILLTIGLFFTSWIFYSGNFTKITEILFSACTAIFIAYISVKFLNSTNNYIEFLKEKIRNLVDVIILEAPEHVKDIKVWDLEIVEPTLDMLDEE